MRHPRLRYLIFFPHVFHLLLVIVFNNPENVLNLLDIKSGEGFASLILEPLSALMKWLILGFTLLLSSEKILFSVINIIYVTVGVYSLFKGRAQVVNEHLREQSGIIVWGISISMALISAGFLIPEILSIEIPGTLRIIILICALGTGGGALIWSIVRHQFVDVTILVRQSLVYTVSSAILVGLYILVVGQADKLFTSFFGARMTIVNIAFIVIFLILFQPINVQLDNLIKRFFIKNRTDYRNIMEQLTRRLISIFDQDQVRVMIEKTLRSEILVEKVYFVLFDDKLGEYILIPSADFPERIIVQIDDLFLGGVNQLDKPALIDRLALYSEGSPLYHHLVERRVQLILPLKDADHLLGFLALTQKISGYRYNAEDITMLGVISNQLVTVLTNTRLYADSLEKQRLHEEISMARQIQLDLLPKNPPASETFQISADSIPSRMIGGDFYDFIPRGNGSFGMVIADASGKGMPAALLVAQIQAMMRAEVRNSDDIARAIANVNHSVAELTSAEKFATLFYGEFDPASGRFRYANAGHNYPLLVRSDGTCEYLTQGGILIGAFGGAEYENGVTYLKENDLLFFYTDGLSEAMNEREEEFGEKRIEDFVIKARNLTPREIVEGVLEEMRKFDATDPPRDDTTIIALKIIKEPTN